MIPRPNTAPQAVADGYSIGRGLLLRQDAPGVLGNDSDTDGNPLRASLAWYDGRGQLELKADGGFTYQPAPGFTGRESFEYRACDGGGLCGTARVELIVTDEVALVSSASRAQTEQGFLRLINRRDQRISVSIAGTDDAGQPGVQSLAVQLAPREAKQLNSQDLEEGNAGKGLLGRLGVGHGDWRLGVSSEPADAVRVLAYNRNPQTGFVTSIHDMVPRVGDRYEVMFFNPASNPEQASYLRLVNPGAVSANVTLRGVDDAGQPGARPVTFSVAAGKSLELSAEALEQGGTGIAGRLGDGSGKWRLSIESSQPLHVMSLVRNPTGDLANVSIAPGESHVWLLPSASRAQTQQGFLRVVNTTGQVATVTLTGVDDAGQSGAQALSLTLAPYQAMQLNSHDLEEGNAGKGLLGRLGGGHGDWWLGVASQPADAVRVLAYNRNPLTGFVTALHDTVPKVDGRHEVAFFNPAGNDAQSSRLRLVNPSATPAAVTIRGVDDAGQPGASPVTLALPAKGAITLDAQRLEQGGAGLEGHLGTGIGKWRLSIESTQPIAVMSLVGNPMGDLTNVSSEP